MEGSGHSQLSATAALVRNPLSVIAMFVLLVETIAGVTLVRVSGVIEVAHPLTWFVVLFPTMIVILFFSTLWWRHERLYSPMEYRSDESFLTAMRDRLRRVEVRQKEADEKLKMIRNKIGQQIADNLPDHSITPKVLREILLDIVEAAEALRR
jgi:hypothetical protein